MGRGLLAAWEGVGKVVIGMVHLPALPGAPGFGGDVGALRAAVLADVEALVSGGVHGLMLENFGDVPFYPGRVPAHVVAQMTALAMLVRERAPRTPLGINVLRNDGRSALAVAQAVGASFIRVNILGGARVTDQGVVEGIAHELLRDRVMLGAQEVRIWADVDVKHSWPLGAGRSLEDEVHDTLERGLADALIVSGAGTGKPTDPEHVRRVKGAAGEHPVLVGSGVSEATVGQFLAHADGVIVGTSLKRGGVSTGPVEAARVRQFMEAMKKGG